MSFVPQGTQTFLPSTDVLFNYDVAVGSLFVIPLDVPFRYTRRELEAKDTPDLRAIAAERGAFSDTDIRPLLIRAILGTQKIPVILASPENAWGDPEYVQGVEFEQSDRRTASIFYPAITIYRGMLLDDPSRYQHANPRKLAWSTDGNAVLQAFTPYPYVYPYQVDTYCLNMKHANMLNMHVQRTFGRPFGVLKIDHGPPWGVVPVMFELANARDTSQLEAAGERGEKLIRYTYDVKLYGWIPRESWLCKTVRSIQWTITDETKPDAPIDLEVIPTTPLPDLFSE